MYDVLMSPDLHRGRWAIVDIQNETQIPRRGSAEYFLIYRTLGVFSTLGTYARHRIVPRRLVLKVWGYSLLDMQEGAKIMRDAEINRLKDSRPDWKPWADLWWLYKKLPSGDSRSRPATTTNPASSDGHHGPMPESDSADAPRDDVV